MPSRQSLLPLVASCLVLTASAAAAGTTVVVADGAAVMESAPSEIGQFRPGRVGRPAEAGVRLDARATFPARSTAAERARWRRARPVPGYGNASAESVVGSDQRKKVTNTTTYPSRAVVQILFSPAESEATFLCSGALIAPNVVLTAGHCIHEGKKGDFYDPDSYRIYPGRNGNKIPYGSCGAQTIYIPSGWAKDGDTVAGQKVDYGAILLDCAIGETTGWFGFFWQTATLQGLPANVWGYPGDKTFGTQWQDSDPVSVSKSRQTFYKTDTAGGQSGSGVWGDFELEGAGVAEATGPFIHSIHAYGVGGAAPGNANNSATRITKAVFNYYVNIIEAND